MKFETRLSLGDKVWVPRVYPEQHLDSVVVDGKTYWASHETATYTYLPAAKQKVITEIDISFSNEGVSEVYWGRNVVNDDEYDDSTIIYRTNCPSEYFSTEAEALEFAKSIAAEGKSYRG